MTIFTDISRFKHAAVGFVLGLLFTIVTVAVAAFAGEYKDSAHGGRFDSKDFWATIIGGTLGQACQAAIVLTVVFG